MFRTTAAYLLAVFACWSALGVPPPDWPLPECELVNGFPTGGCVERTGDLSMSVQGEIQSGNTVVVRAVPGVGVCNSWDIPNDTWSPSPCYSGVGLSDFGRLCGYVDVRTRQWVRGDCRNAMYLDPQGVPSDWIATKSTVYRGPNLDPETNRCFHFGNFAVYFFGGPGNDPQWVWSARGPDAQRCEVTFNGGRPDGLFGPTWMLVGVQSTNRESGADNFPFGKKFERWIRIDGDMRDLGPIAEYTAAVDGATVRFTNESFHSVGEAMTFEWAFGNGMSTSTHPTWEFDEPGDYPVTLTATDLGGDEDTATAVITIERTLAAEISLSGNDLEVGDEITATVTVTSSLERDVTASFADAALRSSDPDKVAVTPISAIPDEFVVAPGESASFMFGLEATGSGRPRVLTRVTGSNTDGDYESEDSATVRVGAELDVTFEMTPPQVFLNAPEMESAPRSARCLALESQREDVTNCVEIKATIKNTSNRTISDVNVEGLTEGAHKGLTITALTGDVGVPLTFIELVPAAGTAQMPQGVTLGPDDTADIIWRLEAFDGPAKVRLRTLVSANDNGSLVTKLGENSLSIVKDVLAEVRIRPTRVSALPLNVGDPLQGLAGSGVFVGGNIENVSEDQTLEVELQEVVTGNAGHGILYAPSKWGRGRTPDARQPFIIEAGETLDLFAAIRTLRAEVAANATVEYFVSAKSLTQNEDGSVSKTDVSDQVVFIDDVEEGWMNPVRVRMLPNPPEEFDPIDECGTWYFTCGVVVGVESLATGLWDMGKLIGNGILTLGNAELRLLAWTADMVPVVMKAVLGDPVAREALIAELVIDFQALVDTGKYTLAQGQTLAGAVGQALEDGVGDFGDALANGDLEQVQFTLGRFIGENPDLLPFETAILKAATAKAVKNVRGVEGANKITREAVEELAKKNDDIVEVSARYDAGRNAGMDVTRDVAEPGDLVAEVVTDASGGPRLKPDGTPLGTSGPVPRYWGVSPDEVLKAIKVAMDENVLISFRSRALEAITLIRNNLAWPKPGAYPVKGTTEIDIRYLGYPQNRWRPDGTIDPRYPTTKGTTDIVEPPPQLLGHTEDTLDAAVDAYMGTMVQRFPELGTDVELFNVVRNRLKTRAEEWPKNTAKVREWVASGGMPVSFGYRKQGIFGFFRDPIAGKRPVRLVERTIQGPDGPRKVIQVDIADVDGTDFRAITGDIDLLAILNANGTMLLNPFKRVRIYKKLQTVLGMQHGESFTFALSQSLRAGWLRCCARGVVDEAGRTAEKLVVAQPNGKARIGEFVENKSITIDSPNSGKRIDKTGDFIQISGIEYALAARKGVVDRLKFNALSEAITQVLGAQLIYTIRSLLLFAGGDDGLTSETEPLGFSRADSATIAIPDGDGGLLAWVPGVGFRPALAEDLLGPDGRLELLPQTSLTGSVAAGALSVSIASLEDFEAVAGSPWFEVGDMVVFNPGGDTQEVAEIVEFGSFVFREPLRFSHDAGEMVSLILDPDGDGVTNAYDVFPDDPTEHQDSDGDGVGNVADMDDDNDGVPDGVDNDMDGDGMDNDYEIAMGFDPMNPGDSLRDPDLDGASTLAEYQDGSDPLDGESMPEVATAPVLVSSVLPTSRSVKVDALATAFATIINTSDAAANGCSVVPLTPLDGAYFFQTTDPTTNAVTGGPNAPVDIPGQGLQTFVFGLVPGAELGGLDVVMRYDCANTEPAPQFPGINSIQLSADYDDVPDVVALVAASAGTVDLDTQTGNGVFAVATVNVGAAGRVNFAASMSNPQFDTVINWCETDAQSLCIDPLTSTPLAVDVVPGGTRTFGVFVTGIDPIPFAPGQNRINVIFYDDLGVVRGSSSVAVRTLAP